MSPAVRSVLAVATLVSIAVVARPQNGAASAKDRLYDDPRVTTWSKLVLENRRDELLRSVMDDLRSIAPHPFAAHFWVRTQYFRGRLEEARAVLPPPGRVRDALGILPELYALYKQERYSLILERWPADRAGEVEDYWALSYLYYVAKRVSRYRDAFEYARIRAVRFPSAIGPCLDLVELVLADERVRPSVDSLVRPGGELHATRAGRLLVRTLRYGRLVPEDALEAVKEWLDVYPRDGAAYAIRGRLCLRLGQWDEAILAHEDSVAMYPLQASVDVLASLLIRRGREAEARRHLERFAMLSQPDDRSSRPVAEELVAQELLEAGEPDRARRVVETALAEWPARARLCAILAEVELADGHPAAAVSQARRAAKLEPDDAEHVTRLAKALREAGDLDEAATVTREAEGRLRNLGERFYGLWSVILAELDRVEARVDVCSRAVARRPGSAYLRREFAAALLAAGRPDEARRSFEVALRIDPTNIRAVRMLCDVIEEQQGPDARVAALAKGRKSHPWSHAYWEESARRAPDLRGKLDLWREAIAANPGRAWPWASYLDVLVRESRWDAAEAAALEMLEAVRRGPTGEPARARRILSRVRGLPELSFEAIGPIAEITALAFRPDSTVLAVGTADRDILLWSLEEGRVIDTLRGHRDAVTALRFSPDGRLLLSGSGVRFGHAESEGLSAKLWDVATRRLLRSFTPTLLSPVHDVDFDPTGTRLVILGSFEIDVYDTRSGRGIIRMETASWSDPRAFREGGSSRFTPDGRRIVVAGADGPLVFLDATTLEVTAVGAEPLAALHAPRVAIRPDGEIILTARGGRPAALWSGSGSLRATIGTEASLDVAFSPDGRRAAEVGSGGGSLLDPTTGKRLRRLKRGSLSTTVAFSPDGRLLVEGGRIGTINFWDVSTGTIALTVAARDRGVWLVAAPDRRFDASPAALESAYYVQGLDTIPLTSLVEEFATPGLLSRVLGRETRDDSRREEQGSIPLPPLVEIESARIAKDGQSAVLVVRARPRDEGVDEVRLYHNGKLVAGGARGVAIPGGGPMRHEVPLVPGENEFVFTAFNRSRIESDRPASVVLLSQRPQARADLFILTIGLDSYANAAYDLAYARADASALMDVVTRRGRRIFRSIVPTMLHDREATRAGVLAALDRVADAARPEDVFLLYFAGHGVLGADSDFHLVLHGVTRMHGSPETRRREGLSARELRERLVRIRARKQLAIFDACHSGGAVRTLARRGAAEERAILQLGRSAGAVVFASAGSNQPATEVARLGHGIFTYALIEGMLGKADGGSGDRKITVAELQAWLNDRVPALTREHRGRPQYPLAWSWGMDFPICVSEE